MKIVKVSAVVLAALVAVVLIGPAFIGQSFEVEKSIVVAASASKPYALLAELARLGGLELLVQRGRHDEAGIRRQHVRPSARPS